MRSTLKAKAAKPAGDGDDDPGVAGRPPAGSMRRMPRTARSSSVAERSSSVTAPMRHRAPASAGGTPSGTSRRYSSRARGRYSRPPEKKSTAQTTRAAPVAAPETAQAMTVRRCSASTWARARARSSLAARASCASAASRPGSTSKSMGSVSASASGRNSTWASTKVAGGKSSIAKPTVRPLPRTTPFSGPCPQARTSPSVASSGSSTSARTLFIGTSQPLPISCQLSSAVSA